MSKEVFEKAHCYFWNFIGFFTKFKSDRNMLVLMSIFIFHKLVFSNQKWFLEKFLYAFSV